MASNNSSKEKHFQEGLGGCSSHEGATNPTSFSSPNPRFPNENSLFKLLLRIYFIAVSTKQGTLFSRRAETGNTSFCSCDVKEKNVGLWEWRENENVLGRENKCSACVIWSSLATTKCAVSYKQGMRESLFFLFHDVYGSRS